MSFSSGPAFARYTEQARRVIFFALHEAQRSGGAKIAPEHVALGLFAENRQMIEALIPTQQVEALRERLSGGLASGAPLPLRAELPLAGETQTVLALAEKLARGDKVMPLHILAALATGRSRAAQILAEYGITPDSMRFPSR